MWLIGLSIGFLVQIALAWWRGSALARVAAVGLALALFTFCQPNAYRALRHAAELPESARATTNLWTKQPATPYESGLFTMYEAAREDIAMDANFRDLAVGVLAVLALMSKRRPQGGTGEVLRGAPVVGGSAATPTPNDE